MPYKSLLCAVALLVVCVPGFAQESQDVWSWAHRTEVRANYDNFLATARRLPL